METEESAARSAAASPAAATSASQTVPSGTHCGFPSLTSTMVLSAVASVVLGSVRRSTARERPDPWFVPESAYQGSVLPSLQEIISGASWKYSAQAAVVNGQ